MLVIFEYLSGFSKADRPCLKNLYQLTVRPSFVRLDLAVVPTAPLRSFLGDTHYTTPPLGACKGIPLLSGAGRGGCCSPGSSSSSSLSHSGLLLSLVSGSASSAYLSSSTTSSLPSGSASSSPLRACCVSPTRASMSGRLMPVPLRIQDVSSFQSSRSYCRTTAAVEWRILSQPPCLISSYYLTTSSSN